MSWLRSSKISCDAMSVQASAPRGTSASQFLDGVEQYAAAGEA